MCRTYMIDDTSEKINAINNVLLTRNGHDMEDLRYEIDTTRKIFIVTHLLHLTLGKIIRIIINLVKFWIVILNLVKFWIVI